MGQCRVLVPDLLGFGDSSDPLGDFHAPGQAAALLELLDRLSIGAAHVVGFDFGGPIALTLYETAPHRFLSLTLIATNAFPDTAIPPPLNLARVPILGEVLFFALCSWPGLASLWFPAAGDKKALPFGRFLRKIPSQRSRRWVRRVFLESLRNLHDRYAPVAKVLATISCPAAVLWGNADPFFPLAVGQRTARAIPGSRFIVLAGCGHFVPEERPADVVGAMLAHIR
jgi:pimeloyl-ACP methyl ester carboxylesterase